MRCSAIIPVYNNEATLSHVVDVLLAHEYVGEVIAVNDASRDRSPVILSRYPKVRVITHERNLGKGAGIADGWEAAKSDTVLTVDADLAYLNKSHIDDMVISYTGGVDMVIAARAAGYMPFSWLSGERIYRRSVVAPYSGIARSVGNGIEQVVNYAHRNRSVKLIVSRDIGHVLKYQRETPHIALWQYLKEGWQLAKTEVYLRTYC